MKTEKSPARPATDVDDENLQEVGFVREFFGFLQENKKWWLLPLLLLMLAIGGLLFLAGKNTAIAPFIYTLF